MRKIPYSLESPLGIARRFRSNGPRNLAIKTHARYEETIGNLGTPLAPPLASPETRTHTRLS